ncbi:MAG: hypothetical protein P4L53_07435 [Candidatus Obscuribacterales bacterium]|nr:hypothetical protein [Candidatus Obscuribacterales bacterium]
MKFQTGLLVPIVLLLTAQAVQARSVGHTSGSHGGSGGSYHLHSGHYYSGGYNHNYGYGGYDGYGGYGGYYDPNAWGNSGAYGMQPPPFMQNDPLADYYRQQQINSQMAQQGNATVSSMVLPNQGATNQTQLPTDFGGAQGQSVSSEPVVSVDEGNAVRENFHGSGLFTAVWWKNKKNAWYSSAWDSSWVWNNVDWDTLAAFWRGSGPKTPADYEFGQNITFRDGNVYYGAQPMMTSGEYYHQAQLLAASGASSSSAKGASAPYSVPLVKDWAQFGVFSLIPAGEKFSTEIFQLAVNRDGTVRGNCYNVMNDQLDRVEGEVDKSNSRVCFTVGKNRGVVYDTGLGNLLSAQSPILIHLDKERTQQRALVRLNQSKL